VEGGYYHWTKQAFWTIHGVHDGLDELGGPPWVDVSIYPVLGGPIWPSGFRRSNSGTHGITAWVLQWLIGAALIWIISFLQIRGVRLTALTSIWLGAIMFIPLIIMSAVGFFNWGVHGSTFHLTMLPQGTGITSAFSLGLYVVIWNYMGFELPTSAGDEIVKPKTHVSLSHGTCAHRCNRYVRHPYGRRSLRRCG